MTNSNLLKEAIADAKAVRETAIANAKIALEEAFTPRLQSILSQKLQAEMEGEEEDADLEENEVNVTEAEDDSEEAVEETVTEEEESEEGEEVSEGEYNAEGEEEITAESEEEEISEEEGEDEEAGEEVEAEEEDEDELDLEAIIRELEGELEEELDDEEEGEVEDIANDVVDGHEEEMHDEESSEEEPSEEDAEEVSEEEGEESEEESDEIDLDEILREMGYGDDEEEVNEEESEEEDSELEEVKAELGEAISTIKELKKTINEVNLLNAKLLYTNKLFRSYDLTNEQKMKVVETLDRTGNVREVKLVFSTLAESLKISGTSKKQKQTAKLTESFASKPVASTAPSKEVIVESNTLADRFKQLANIK